MKFRNLFSLLLATTLLFAACEKGTEDTDKTPEKPDTEQPGNDQPGDEKPGDEVKEPVLTLTSEATIAVPVEGGNYEITYTLENPKEGVNVAAECEAEWITDIAVADKVTFTVAANDGDARETKVIVSYEEQSFEVAVEQAKKEPVVPSEPTAFTPVKVKANYCDAGNFILMLYVDDANRHEFDMYDEVGANDNYLSDGTYSSEDGTISLNDTFFYNGTKQVDMAAAKLTLKLNSEDWTFTIEGEFASVEGQAHTISWTGAIEGFVDPNAPEVFEAKEVVASTDNGLTWELVFIENASTLGDPHTRIVVQLAETNALHITDGTYSLANSSIVASTDSSNGSFFRHNRADDGGIMTECELTVAINKDSETAKLSGYFVVAEKTYNFAWDGAVSGFKYKEVISGGITEWQEDFTVQYQDNLNFNGSDGMIQHKYGRTYINAKSIDGTPFKFCLCNPIDPEKNVIGAGTYTVATYDYYVVMDYRFADNTSGTFSSESEINGMALTEGKVIVERDGENYTISFDVTDSAKKNWTGSWTGTFAW